MSEYSATEAPDLFTFAGPVLTEDDLPRLNTHARVIWDAFIAAHDVREGDDIDWARGDGWCELNAMAEHLKMPHSTVTAMARLFRRDANGGHTVERQACVDQDGIFTGTHLFRLKPNSPEGVMLAKARARAKKPAAHDLQAFRIWYRDQLEKHPWRQSPFTAACLQMMADMIGDKPEKEDLNDAPPTQAS